MTEHDPEHLADELEGEADKLQENSDRFGENVEDVRQDWESKRSDASIPGALPPEPGEGERGDQSGWGQKSEEQSAEQN